MSFLLLSRVRNATRLLASALALSAVVGVGVSLAGGKPVYAARRDDKDTTAYTIKRVYKAGEVDRYKLTMKMTGDGLEGPLDITSTLITKETTKEADDDGSYTVLFEIEKMTNTAEGMDMDVTDMLPKITMKRDKNGKKSVKTEGGAEDFTAGQDEEIKQFTEFSAAFLPGKPVKIGQSWEVDASAFGDAKKTKKGKATLVSVETVKGVKLGKIRSEGDEIDEENRKMHSDIVLLIDMATGKTVSFTATGEGDALEGKVRMVMTMKMLGANEKTDGKDVFKADSEDKP